MKYLNTGMKLENNIKQFPVPFKTIETSVLKTLHNGIGCFLASPIFIKLECNQLSGLSNNDNKVSNNKLKSSRASTNRIRGLCALDSGVS